MQTRDISLEKAEIKFLGTKDTRTFAGYASVFGGVDSYGDTIVRGAYEESLKKRRPLMFYGHNPGRVIGKWISAKEDDRGLLVEGELTPGHSDADDVYASLKHGAMSGLSIGFYPIESEETEKGRILRKLELVEVSIVSMPADDAARIDGESVKAAITTLNSIRDCEAFLRDSGSLSRSVAAAFVSRFKALTQGDPAEVAEMKRRITQLETRNGELLVELISARAPIPTSLRS